MKREEIDLICDVEGDAPMAKIFRSYWLPALRSVDLEADGAPRRVRLLGQNYVAFRDTNGDVGLLDEYCPHRGVSLTLARNENCTLQCLYHGWRMDRSGQIVETPAEPGGRNTIGTNVRQPSYPVTEAGQVIWVYLGEPDKQPPPPRFDFTEMPEEHVLAFNSQLQCNWLRGLDGGFDTAHVMYLHADGLRANWADSSSDARTQWQVDGSGDDVAPRIEVERTPYGLRYAGIRQADAPGMSFMRSHHFVVPCYAYIPATTTMANVMAFVPIDNEHTLHWGFTYRIDGFPMSAEERADILSVLGKTPGVDQDDEGRSFQNASNHWGQDRGAMMRRESFSGIPGIWTEDYAVQESMPPNVHERENLAKTDLAIIRVRRILIELARGVANGTSDPPVFPRDFDLRRLRALEKVVASDTDWREVAPWRDVDDTDVPTAGVATTPAG